MEEREIERVLIRYATAIDDRDWDLLRSCFTEAPDVEYEDIGTWDHVDQVVAFMDEAHAGIGRSNHRLSNMTVTVDGDQATARTYVHAVLTLAVDPSEWVDAVGSYDDELVRTADGWRIRRRRYRSTVVRAGRS